MIPVRKKAVQCHFCLRQNDISPADIGVTLLPFGCTEQRVVSSYKFEDSTVLCVQMVQNCRGSTRQMPFRRTGNGWEEAANEAKTTAIDKIKRRNEYLLQSNSGITQITRTRLPIPVAAH
jgi:hypothetical protein